MAYRSHWRRYGYLLPGAIFVAAVAMVPVAYNVWLSFRRVMPIFGISEPVGWQNYAFILHDARFLNSLGVTGYFVLLSVSLEVAIGMAMALLLNRTVHIRGLAWGLAMVPWAIPGVVAARFWEWIFNADFGVLNYLLGRPIQWLGDPLWAIHAAILADVWKSTPFVILLLLAGLQVIPAELYQAAKMDGAGPWQSFRHITWPLLRPYLLLALLFRTVDAARVFDLIFVLTGGGPANQTETIVVYSYKLLYRTLQFGYGSAVSMVSFLLILLPTLAYVLLIRRAWSMKGA